MRSRFRIVLSLDANKNIYSGKLQKAFFNLELLETSQLFFDQPLLAPFHKGSNQIGAIQVSPNIRLTLVAITPTNFRVGNYKVIIINFLANTILGKLFVSLCYIDIRRLITCQPFVVPNYIS